MTQLACGSRSSPMRFNIRRDIADQGSHMRQIAHPFIIDIEASGFGPYSYPIEIGLALEPGIKFCSLIAPAPDWTHWDAEAEKVHRVPRDILETHGKPAIQVAVSLNELLGNTTVYSDGWVVDKPWLIQLFSRTGVPQQFSISPLEMILSERQMEVWHKIKKQVTGELALTRHRASFDALIIQETYLRTRRETEQSSRSGALNNDSAGEKVATRSTTPPGDDS